MSKHEQIEQVYVKFKSATDPDERTRLRNEIGNLLHFMPGYGAQMPDGMSIQLGSEAQVLIGQPRQPRLADLVLFYEPRGDDPPIARAAIVTGLVPDALDEVYLSVFAPAAANYHVHTRRASEPGEAGCWRPGEATTELS